MKSGTDLICDFMANGTFKPETTVNAVFIAKSRVLARLRQEAAGLLEC